MLICQIFGVFEIMESLAGLWMFNNINNIVYQFNFRLFQISILLFDKPWFYPTINQGIMTPNDLLGTPVVG